MDPSQLKIGDLYKNKTQCSNKSNNLYRYLGEINHSHTFQSIGKLRHKFSYPNILVKKLGKQKEDFYPKTLFRIKFFSKYYFDKIFQKVRKTRRKIFLKVFDILYTLLIQ